MKVLVACEMSGAVRDAFIRLGHDAPSLVTSNLASLISDRITRVMCATFLIIRLT